MKYCNRGENLVKEKKQKKVEELKKNQQEDFSFNNTARVHKRLVSQILRIFVLIMISLGLVYAGTVVKIKKIVTYKENNKIGYKVYLKENSFYDKEYLEGDMRYVAKLIDTIELDFSSVFQIDEKAKMDYNYTIKGHLKITDANNNDKELYTKEYRFVEDTKQNLEEINRFNINELVQIDYQMYNEIAQEFKMAYTNSVNCALVVELKVDFKAKPNTFDNDFDDSYTANISIPLTTQTIGMKVDTKNNVGNTIKTEIVNSDISNVLYIIAVFPFLFALVLFVGTIKYARKGMGHTTQYEAYVKKILREYDRAIAEIEGDYSFEGCLVVEVKVFEELIDIYEAINQPIICIKDIVVEEEKQTVFLIKNNNDVYRYVVKEKDFMNV